MSGINWGKMPFIADWLEVKMKKAAQEARRQGEQEVLSGMQDMLLEVLYSRFGSVPSRTIRAIHTVQSPSKLKTLARKSLKAESLAEVQKLLPASKTNGRRLTNSRKPARASK